MLSGVQGRASDFIETPDGRRIHTIVFYYAFCGLEAKGCEVKAFQVVKVSAEELRLRVIRGAKFHEGAFLEAVNKLREITGGGLQLRHEYVDEIPRSRSGKFRDFISESDEVG